MERFRNIKRVYSEKKYALIGLVSGVLMVFLLFYFSSIDLIAGNMGKTYAGLLISLEVILVVLFAVNMPLLFYKLKVASVGKKVGGSSFFGSVFGAVAAGCPVCGITLASYLGLGAVIGALPFYGLELKVLAVLLLGYSTNSLAKGLFVCKR